MQPALCNSHARRTGIAVTACVLVCLHVAAHAADTLASPISVVNDHLSRGDTVQIRIQDGPTAKVPVRLTLSLDRDHSVIQPAGEVSYSPAAPGTPGVITARIPDDAPFGTYSTRIQIDERSQPGPKLVVGPPGGSGVSLAEFDPKETYAGSSPVHDVSGKSQRTVDLVLRGKGFLRTDANAGISASDNAIWINGVRQRVTWDEPCTSNPPKDGGIRGDVISGNEVRLCYVPVPPNGQLLVAAGIGDTMSEIRAFRVFNWGTAPVAILAGAIALVLALLPLLLLRFVRKSYRIGGKNYRLRMLFLDPETDTYSLSKFQFYDWTVAAIFAYAYLYISRVHVQLGSWPDVPATLPGIIVVAAGTAVGSQLVTSAKGSKGAGEENPSIADFITSGGVVAPDRLQMFLWTIVGVGAFLYAVLQQAPGVISELPTVPERLLVLMGISSAGYLGGKMARKPGPVINEISVMPPDSDEGIRNESSAPAPLPDVIEPVVEARSALAAASSATHADASTAVDALQQAVTAVSAAQTVSDFNQLIADLGTFRDKAESAAARIASDFLADKASAADAQTAQAAAAALQELTAGVIAAIATAASVPMAAEENPVPIARTIELRGTNLSPDAMLQIDSADLPFQMLLDKEGKNLPDIVVRDDVNPTFARILRLNLDPARMPDVYSRQVEAWFGNTGPHKFTIINPDGQQSELTFDIPPAVAQKIGVAS